MEQMEDETTTKVDLKNIGTRTPPEESPTRQTGGKTQSRCENHEWKVDAHSETEVNGREIQKPPKYDAATSPLFSLKLYLRRPPSLDSSSSSLTSQSSNTGIDCAGIVLNCLFCQFYDYQKITNQCCPNYQQVTPTAQSPVSSEESSYTDWDCGLLASCKDANDCLELAMEVSEICYH
ncbi:myoD family inhibitor domain-containing protein 2 [Boleophthalmus pectinirostris]|uniref:myoD family inhibitor domain-containing protein 2 n=1 Tax=Boleophthalmus pectinirostris TaxID=150288 RepID=UPI000A1C6E3B|nr:myoD family inhibitor domain-containing protein 2 [Boleophthalmus pectinirostris]